MTKLQTTLMNTEDDGEVKPPILEVVFHQARLPEGLQEKAMLIRMQGRRMRSSEQDLADKDGWKTVEGKEAQKKRRNDKADKQPATENSNKPPTTKTGRRGKTTHQPKTNTPSTKKTWAEVVKSGGINVQIVLGNGNLGLTTPPARRGERRGGAAGRLRKKEGEGERGEEKRDRAGPGVSKGKESGDTGGGVERGEESGGVGGPAAV
ncbi:hypothetical protein BZA77DRAFT_363148 [Pyronema omphalodes]|nr:hypothetical protein BZA77DRAFT_363148 [Pyronema omphalodes]